MPLNHRKMMLLACLSASNLAAGMVMQLYGIAVLGAGPATDTFFAAQTVPMVLSAIFSGALVNNMTPILAALETNARGSLVRAVAFRVAVALVLVIAVMSLTAGWWVRLFFSNLPQANEALVISLMPILCATFGIAMLTSVAISGQYAKGGFLYVEVTQLAVTLVLLVIVKPVVAAFGVVGFALLLFLRAALTFITVGTSFLKGERVPIAPHVGELWARMRKILAGSVIFKLGPLVDRSLSSLAGAGMLTSIGVGQQIAASSATVTDRVLSRPLLAAAGARVGNVDAHASREILELYRRQLRFVGWGGGVLLACILALVLAVTVNRPLTNSIHLHSIGQLDLILVIALSAVPAAASQLSSTLMYAVGKPATISRLALLSFLISTVFKVLGFLMVGVYAIAAGIILYQVLNWLFLHLAALRSLGGSNPLRDAGTR